MLDLNNYTVIGGNGINVAPSFNRVTIKNGYFANITDTVITTSNNTAIILSDLSINNCDTGISMNLASDFFINNVGISGVISVGMEVFGCENGTIQNCQVIRSTPTSSAAIRGFYITDLSSIVSKNINVLNCFASQFTDGFFSETVENITVDACIAKNCGSVGFVIGGSNANNAILMKNCSALDCIKAGLSAGPGDSTAQYTLDNCSVIGLGASLTTFGFNLSRSNGIIRNCTVTNSGTAIGFRTSGASNGIIINCNAESLAAGFQSTISSSNWIFTDCTANFNSIGFDFSDASISNIQIKDCTANNNVTGFSGNSSTINLVVFYLNTASNNGTNYTGVTFAGSQSAPEKTFMDPTRLYGDNLKNM